MTGWLFGAATAPVLTGYVALRAGLGFAISLAAVALFIAAGLLILAMSTTLRRDVERMNAELAQPRSSA
jgi:Flp pilus assembly protein TadB